MFHQVGTYLQPDTHKHSLMSSVYDNIHPPRIGSQPDQPWSCMHLLISRTALAGDQLIILVCEIVLAWHVLQHSELHISRGNISRPWHSASLRRQLGRDSTLQGLQFRLQ